MNDPTMRDREGENPGRRHSDRSQSPPSPLTEDDAKEIRAVSTDLAHWLRARKSRFALLSAMVFIVLAIGAILSVGIVRNVNRIRDNQRHAATIQRESNYRACVRADIPRAELLLSAAQRKGDRAIYEGRQHREPVFDCEPLREGSLLPQPLAVQQQDVFVEFYARTCRAPIVRYGRVMRTPDPVDGQGEVICFSTQVKLPG